MILQKKEEEEQKKECNDWICLPPPPKKWLKIVSSDLEIGFRSGLETGRNTHPDLYTTTLSSEAAKDPGHLCQQQS